MSDIVLIFFKIYHPPPNSTSTSNLHNKYSNLPPSTSFLIVTHTQHPLSRFLASIRKRVHQSITMLRSVAAIRRRSCMIILKDLMMMKNKQQGMMVGREITSSSAGGRLEGKVALITGAASGLGKATAREFIHQGAKVIIADINTKLGPQAAEELGPQSHFVKCDVAIESEVAEAVDFAMSQHGKLDILYNNAGIVGPSIPPSIVDLNLDEFDRVMRVNVRGTMAGIKHAVRVMMPMNSGSILCTASISGLMGGLGPHPYSVSKFTLPGIVKSVASEVCGHGIRINCISPFAIPTPTVVDQMATFYPGPGHEWIEKMVYGLGELKGAKCEEIDIARAAVFLASDEAKYISGHNLVVDGGFTCFKQLNLPRPDQI